MAREDVEDGPDQAHPDGPLPLKMPLPKPGYAEDRRQEDTQHPTTIPIETWNMQYSAEWLYAFKYYRCKNRKMFDE